MSKYIVGENKPFQQQWFSRSAKIQISETDQETALLDAKSKLLNIKKAGSEFVITEPMSKIQLSNLENMIENSLDLIPFSKISDIPAKVEWNLINTEPNTINDGTIVYELIMEEEILNKGTQSKYRYTLMADTYLPVKIEFFRKISDQSGFSPETYTKIDYPDDETINEIQQHLFK